MLSNWKTSAQFEKKASDVHVIKAYNYEWKSSILLAITGLRKK